MESTAFATYNPAPSWELSSWGRRALAYALDVGVIVVWIEIAVETAVRVPSRSGTVMSLAFLLIPVYFAVGDGGASGKTLGKRIMGIATRREDGGPVGYARALGRSLTRAAVGFVPILNLVAIFRPLWDGENRAFHDDIAKTRVVYLGEATTLDRVLLFVAVLAGTGVVVWHLTGPHDAFHREASAICREEIPAIVSAPASQVPGKFHELRLRLGTVTPPSDKRVDFAAYLGALEGSEQALLTGDVALYRASNARLALSAKRLGLSACT